MSASKDTKNSIASKKVVAVDAWACGQCDRVYLDHAEAVDCCTCNDCKCKFPKRGYSAQCGGCAYGQQLRNTRADVRRAESSLRSAKKYLARTLAEGNPGKGTAP